MSLNPNLYALLSETSEPTQVTAQYVWGARPGHRDELILRDRDTGGGSLDERLYCLMDYFDPTAVIDPSGAVVERYGWSAFGQRRVMDADWELLASSAVSFDFGFHGQFLDGETGYYNYGYRYYSPQIGRWLSRDPIGERGGSNLYNYSKNSSPNAVDYLGLFPNLTAQTSIYSSGYCGDVFWKILWKLSLPSAVGGRVIQHVKTNWKIKKCKDEMCTSELVSGEGFPQGDYEFWESWEIKRNSDASTGFDTWRSSEKSCTCGKVTIDSDVEFFEGYNLPDAFYDNEDVPFASDVPQFNFWVTADSSVVVDFPSPIDQLKRRMVFEWDCCNGRNATTVTERSPK